MPHIPHLADYCLFIGFVVLSFLLILFRRFHQYQSIIRPNEVGPTAWGLYPPTKNPDTNDNFKTRSDLK